MFESGILLPGAGTAEEGALRPIDWHELVARLGAARELRDLSATSGSAGGGFLPHIARGIAAQEGGEPGVNLGGLSAGKWADATTAAAAMRADHGDRDKR